MSVLESPIPLSDIEDVLAWVDTFKLSRATKKINRDFSDAVLLAEILSVHYPKLVEMHNYPPRNSHSLKLNNWMTLNRKVLKRLRLNLCLDTMEQLANCKPGVVERVLLMVRDKVRRDEEMNKTLKEVEQNMSSGGSYYEACGDDEHVLVVPVKTRVNGVLETIQKKVVSHEYYIGLKEELKDAKDSAEILKQKVEHLDSLIKLKEERIEELQKQLDRRQTRRREIDAISEPFEPELPTPNISDLVNVPSRSLSLKSVESNTRVGKEESKIPVLKTDVIKLTSKPSITEVVSKNFQEQSKLSITEVVSKDFQEDPLGNVERIKSNVFKEVEIIDQRVIEGFHDSLEYINEPDAIAASDDKENNMKKDIDYSYESSCLNTNLESITKSSL